MWSDNEQRFINYTIDQALFASVVDRGSKWE